MIEIDLLEESAANYEALARIHNSYSHIESTSAEMIQRRRQAFPKAAYFQRFIMKEHGELIASGTCLTPFWMQGENRLLMGLSFLPDVDGTPHARRFFDFILDHCLARSPITIDFHTEEHHRSVREFLLRAGFEVKTVASHQAINLNEFQPKCFEELREKLVESCFEFKSVADFIEQDIDWKPNYLKMINRLFKDIPFHGEFNDMPMSEFEAFNEMPNRDHRFEIVAIKDGEYVALTELGKDVGDPTKMSTALTGVDRQFRRMGLAKTLKAEVLTRAKAAGIQIVITENEVNNPMRKLNVELGFKHVSNVEYHQLTLSSA